jgi:hypothetical protein
MSKLCFSRVHCMNFTYHTFWNRQWLSNTDWSILFILEAFICKSSYNIAFNTSILWLDRSTSHQTLEWLKACAIRFNTDSPYCCHSQGLYSLYTNMCCTSMSRQMNLLHDSWQKRPVPPYYFSLLSSSLWYTTEIDSSSLSFSLMLFSMIHGKK